MPDYKFWGVSTLNRTFSLITKARQGDKLSEEIIIEENMPLVHSCVRKLMRDELEYDDLLQLGSIGLIKAIRRFDVNFGVRFSTYAVPLIMGEIRRFLRDDGMIKVSRGLKEIKYKALCAHDKLSLSLKREPTLSEIAAYISTDTEKLILAMEACSPCESLQRSISKDGTGEITLADTVADSKEFGDELEKIALETALSSLSPRDRKIIVLRYLKGKTQAEVSKLIGVSQVQISRIEKRVLSSLRQELD